MTSQEPVNTYVGGEVQEGLKGIRYQIGMYLGSTGVTSDRHAPRALTQMAQETVSNSRDEILAGYGDRIDVVIHPDNAITIRDHGRGIPKGPDDSFREVIKMLTKSHASGKFDSDNYASAGVAGMHGIGMKAVNAASKYVKIDAVSHATREAADGGKDELTGELERYSITFNQEDVVEKSHEPNVPSDTQTGTSITFLPDDGPVGEDRPRPLFESIKWVVADLEPTLESTAVLMPGTTVTLIDERDDEPEQKVWLYENGLADYVNVLTEGQQSIIGQDPIVISEEAESGGYEFTVNAALSFTDDTSADVFSFANGVPTREGGPHMTGFMKAVTNAVNSARERIGSKSSKKAALIESDVASGLTAAFEVKIPAEIVSFEGQTKEKLGTTLAHRAVRSVVESSLLDWLLDNEKFASRIVSNAEASASARADLAKAKRDAHAASKTKSSKNKLVTSSKLKTATSRNPSERELYIVEGDSASEIGRDPKTQAVFPIRGKIRNVMSVSLADALKNTEIATLVETIGAGIGPSFKLGDVQYNKIIIAADADSDGSHIKMLLTTFFYLYMPELIEAGMLYTLKPPLFRAEKYTNGKRDLVVAYTDTEMRERMSSLSGYEISRYKGLGMMERDEAHRYIADPEHRRLERLVINDQAAAKRQVNLMMGNDATPRRKWIESNVNMAQSH